MNATALPFLMFRNEQAGEAMDLYVALFDFTPSFSFFVGCGGVSWQLNLA